MQSKSVLARFIGAAALAFGGLHIGHGAVQVSGSQGLRPSECRHTASRAQRRAEYIANNKRWRNKYAPYAYSGAKLARKAAAGRVGLARIQ